MGGNSRVAGILGSLEVQFECGLQMPIAVDFAVLHANELLEQDVAILGLEQLELHRMILDFGKQVVRVGGADGHLIRLMDPYLAEFRMRHKRWIVIKKRQSSNWYEHARYRSI